MFYLGLLFLFVILFIYFFFNFFLFIPAPPPPPLNQGHQGRAAALRALFGKAVASAYKLVEKDEPKLAAIQEVLLYTKSSSNESSRETPSAERHSAPP